MGNCGADGESCCASLAVPGGTFFLSYDYADGGPAMEANSVSVTGLRIDKYLVTVGRFRQFIQAWNNGTGWVPAAGSGKHTHLNCGKGLLDSNPENAALGATNPYETGWNGADNANIAPSDANLACGRYDPQDQTWTSSPGSQENLPINCANWYEAYAFCIWDGGFLPSEEEWEFAAAGGDQQREYPWGAMDPGMSNAYAVYGGFYKGPADSGANSFVAPVGSASAGAGRWGQLDIAGELAQWTVDMWLSSYTQCSDCALLTYAYPQPRVTRGDGFDGPLISLRAVSRDSLGPGDRSTGVGIRCARTP